MRRRVGSQFLALSLLFGCASPKIPALSLPNAAAAPAKAAGPRERLAQALRSIPRPGPVLDALPAEARQRLQRRLAGLDAERRLSVHNDESPLVETLPLLHLESGGTSPRALFALATTSAGSEELAGISSIETALPGSSPDVARIELARELAQRAALEFLRDRAADVALGGKGSALVCRVVARAAEAVERRDLILLAHETLANAAPDAENILEFAEELARSGAPQLAAQRLLEARSDQRHPAPPGLLAAAEQLIEFARVATAPPSAKSGVPEAVARARAWLRLGRVSEARRVLESQPRAAKTRLDLAAAIAETLMERPSCPDLPLDVGSASLCALAFRSSERVQAARALLASAWQSQTGRDDEAIEVYAALSLIIPWMHETAAEISQGSLTREVSSARVAVLLDKLRELAAVAPRLAGLPLFLETVHSGPSLRVAGLRSEPDADALSTRALSLAGADSSRFSQAGVFAVAAALARQRDISALLDAIPAENTAATLRVPRAALGVWVAASGGQSVRMDAARSELAAIMSEGQGGSLERARLVLGVTEADALLDASDRSYQLLSRVAGQLLNDNIPADLALRAVLDASGALAHGQRYEQAEKILNGAASAELPPNFERAQDLLRLIKGYKLVLNARGAQLSSLPLLRADLGALAARAHGEAVTVWFDLWSRELDALQQSAECAQKKLKICRAAAVLRRDARRGLDSRLGAAAAAVLERGALPSASFDAGFRFTIEHGLEPLIIFDPSFLAVGLPQIAAD